MFSFIFLMVCLPIHHNPYSSGGRGTRVKNKKVRSNSYISMTNYVNTNINNIEYIFFLQSIDKGSIIKIEEKNETC